MADYPDFAGAAQKLLDQQARINDLAAEVARLRTGEEDGYDPLVRPTPGQWLQKFNQSPAVERLTVVARVIDACTQASTCFEMNHDGRIRQLEELLRVAHETSNRSEVERAAAVQRAEQAEAAIERVRDLHQPRTYRGQTICGACSDYDPSTDSTDSAPVPYDQCATLRALDGAEQPDGPPSTARPQLDSPTRERIASEVSRVLDDYPEHNRTDEHEHVVREITNAVQRALTGTEQPTTEA